QGVDPEQQGLNQTSGEAMKFVYSLLELKAGKSETEFKLGFNELIRAILQFSGKSAENIIQTWTRTSIKNDSELVEMCSKSNGIISRKTILLNHPFVEDAETEEKQLEEDAKKAAERMDIYKDNDDDGEGGED
ncbi:MAG: phage portal protein, partial [Acidaminococcaceae bacterium]|nr:phage portal protein [Acidaminococcaceae bacterium]